MRKLSAAALILLTVLLAARPCFASEYVQKSRDYGSEVIEIYTAEELFAVSEDPSGRYALMNDIDLNGYDWIPIEFRGLFEGNGHTIMNIHIRSLSENTGPVYDCNHKPYYAHFGGFFSSLESAEVRDLVLMNADYRFECGGECAFTGALAGYVFDSFIVNVSVYGRSYMSSAAKCWGSGGFAGYGGSSMILGCTSSMSISMADLDEEYKDEQFMGGAYALGYIDLLSNRVFINGYSMEHGYVHDGGLVGSYYKYDGCEKKGIISENSVDGKISFFENNKNRRAYCSAYIGEIMDWSLDMDGNTQNFVRDEIYDYGKTIEPHWDCAYPKMVETVIESNYGAYGCTLHSCENCDYAYSDNYKPFKIRAEKCAIRIEPPAKSFYAGECYNLSLIFTPENADPVSCELVSDNEAVAVSYEGGILYIKDKGLAHITAIIDGEPMAVVDIDAGSRSDKAVREYGVYAAMASSVLAAVCVAFLRKKKK